MSFKNFAKIGQVIKSKKTGKIYVIVATPKSGKNCNVLELSKDNQKVVGGTAFICDMVTPEFYETVSGKIALDALTTTSVYLRQNINRIGEHIYVAFMDKICLLVTQWGLQKAWFKQVNRERRQNKESALGWARQIANTCYRVPVVTSNLYQSMVQDRECFSINKKSRTVSVFGRDTKLFNY